MCTYLHITWTFLSRALKLFHDESHPAEQPCKSRHNPIWHGPIDIHQSIAGPRTPRRVIHLFRHLFRQIVNIPSSLLFFPYWWCVRFSMFIKHPSHAPRESRPRAYHVTGDVTRSRGAGRRIQQVADFYVTVGGAGRQSVTHGTAGRRRRGPIARHAILLGGRGLGLRLSAHSSRVTRTHSESRQVSGGFGSHEYRSGPRVGESGVVNSGFLHADLIKLR